MNKDWINKSKEQERNLVINLIFQILIESLIYYIINKN